MAGLFQEAIAREDSAQKCSDSEDQGMSLGEGAKHIAGLLLPGRRDAVRGVNVAANPVQRMRELLPSLDLSASQTGLRKLAQLTQLGEDAVYAAIGKSVNAGEVEADILKEIEEWIAFGAASSAAPGNKTAWRKSVATGVGIGIVAGVATGGLASVLGASAVIATGAGTGTFGLASAMKVEEANIVHSETFDKTFLQSRCALPIPDSVAAVRDAPVDGGVSPPADIPCLDKDVVKQFYLAKSAYTRSSDTLQEELGKIFQAFDEGVPAAKSALAELPWFWRGPDTEAEVAKWYIALSPDGNLHIVMRGTENIEDWLHNFNSHMENESSVYHQYSRRESWLPNMGGPDLSFHRGFWHRAVAVAEEMQELFTTLCAAKLGKAAARVTAEELEHFVRNEVGSRVKRVQFTGHSLGGAVALILHRVWSSDERFQVLRFMMDRFKPETRDIEVQGSSYRTVVPHQDLKTIVFSAPPIFAAKVDNAKHLQGWLWSGLKRFKLKVEREELDQFSNAQLVFYNGDPVPKLAFLPTGVQLMNAPLSSVLWLREDESQARSVFPVPPKAQYTYFSKVRGTTNVHDHSMDSFEGFVLGLAPADVQDALGAQRSSVPLMSARDFLDLRTQKG